MYLRLYSILVRSKLSSTLQWWPLLLNNWRHCWQLKAVQVCGMNMSTTWQPVSAQFYPPTRPTLYDQTLRHCAWFSAKVLKQARLLQMRNKLKERFLLVTFYVTIYVTRQGKILCIQQTFPTVPNYYEPLTSRPPWTSTKVSVKLKISLHGLAHVNSIPIGSQTLHLCLTSCRIFVNLDQRLISVLKPHLTDTGSPSSTQGAAADFQGFSKHISVIINSVNTIFIIFNSILYLVAHLCAYLTLGFGLSRVITPLIHYFMNIFHTIDGTTLTLEFLLSETTRTCKSRTLLTKFQKFSNLK